MKKKKIYLLFFIILLINPCFSQFSGGAYVGMFHGFRDGFDTQYGVNATAKYDFNNLRIGGNIGYYVSSEDTPIMKTSRYTTPLSAAVEYVFLQKDFYPELKTIKPHVGLELGIYRMGIITSIGSSSTRNFGGGPTAGALMRFSKHFVVDALLKYHFIFQKDSNLSAVSTKIGFLYYF